MNAAEAALARLAVEAAKDATRPAWHFRPPAGWMNDPNGPIRLGDASHLFYQHYPYSGRAGPKHWGHARSPDLVRWEHLPIALEPAPGEECWSGCCALNPDGTPVILYTRAAGTREERKHFDQRAALGDPELTRWRPSPGNPVLSMAGHGGPAVRGDWRDPFVFRAEGRLFMVLGAALAAQGNRPAILIYESPSGSLTQWVYRGIFHEPVAGESVRFFECPNVFRSGGRWVLLYSPFGPVEYRVGRIDLERYRFVPEAGGLVDAGAGYYATNILRDSVGRPVQLAWLRGFAQGRAWDGCLALPRLVSLAPDGGLVQRPIEALEGLRGTHVQLRDAALDRRVLGTAGGLELSLTLVRSGAGPCGVRWGSVEIAWAGSRLSAGGAAASVASDRRIALRLFLDRSTVEVFADDGRCCLSAVVADAVSPAPVVGFGDAVIESLDAWELSSVW